MSELVKLMRSPLTVLQLLRRRKSQKLNLITDLEVLEAGKLLPRFIICYC